MTISQAHSEMGDEHATIEDLARAQHARPVDDPQAEMATDIWESGQELEAFLADLRASRNASLA